MRLRASLFRLQAGAPAPRRDPKNKGRVSNVFVSTSPFVWLGFFLLVVRRLRAGSAWLRPGFRAQSVGQEFSNGAKLLVGGLEAAHEVRGGPNAMGVQFIVDCRENVTRGIDGKHDPLPPLPSGVEGHQLFSTYLSGYLRPGAVEENYAPVVRALLAGRCVLLHCINGKHRSAQSATCAIVPFFRNVEAAMNHVWALRSLIQFTSLSGLFRDDFSPWARAHFHVPQGNRDPRP